MGIYTRYKKQPGGFRMLVELLESTPSVRRQKMVDAGMKEDPDYTHTALSYVLTFQDVLDMPDNELAEVLSLSPVRMVGYAVAKAPQETKDRFLKCCKPQMMAEVKDYMEAKVTDREIGGAQLKLVESARQAEKRGHIKTKRIPLSLD